MAYDKHQAKHEFTRWSKNYDECILQWLLFGRSHRALIQRIRDVAGQQPIRVLDVGCGTGMFAERIRESLPGAQVWGIDLVAGMLDRGADRWERQSGHVMPVQGDSERLPFASGSFDFVTCANSFHHYPHQDRAVAEMNRVLRPGGRLFLIDGYRDAPWGWFIYEFCVKAVEGEVHHATRKRMRELFAQAGFVDVSQKVYRGAAPFLFSEAIASTKLTIPLPHFHSLPPIAAEEHAA